MSFVRAHVTKYWAISKRILKAHASNITHFFPQFILSFVTELAKHIEHLELHEINCRIAHIIKWLEVFLCSVIQIVLCIHKWMISKSKQKDWLSLSLSVSYTNTFGYYNASWSSFDLIIATKSLQIKAHHDLHHSSDCGLLSIVTGWWQYVNGIETHTKIIHFDTWKQWATTQPNHFNRNKEATV